MKTKCTYVLYENSMCVDICFYLEESQRPQTAKTQVGLEISRNEDEPFRDFIRRVKQQVLDFVRVNGPEIEKLP